MSKEYRIRARRVGRVFAEGDGRPVYELDGLGGRFRWVVPIRCPLRAHGRGRALSFKVFRSLPDVLVWENVGERFNRRGRCDKGRQVRGSCVPTPIEVVRPFVGCRSRGS